MSTVYLNSAPTNINIPKTPSPPPPQTPQTDPPHLPPPLPRTTHQPQPNLQPPVNKKKKKKKNPTTTTTTTQPATTKQKQKMGSAPRKTAAAHSSPKLFAHALVRPSACDRWSCRSGRRRRGLPCVRRLSSRGFWRRGRGGLCLLGCCRVGDGRFGWGGIGCGVGCGGGGGDCRGRGCRVRVGRIGRARLRREDGAGVVK